MQSTSAPQTDRTVGVNPPIKHLVPWRVVTVEALPGMRLRVEFVDGTNGEVELKGFLADDRVRGTVFEPLRETAFFARVSVVGGTVEWPNGADLAPDAMYDAIRQSGRWVLS